MRLTFGDITKEVNVFHLGKQPRDLNDKSFEVNLIEGLTSEHEEEMEYESDNEYDLESDDFNLDQIIEFIVEWATNATLIIPLQEEQPSIDHTPSSELKFFLVISSISTLVKRKLPRDNSVSSYGITRRGSSCCVERKLRGHWLDHDRYKGDQPIYCTTSESPNRRGQAKT